jgi:hypothetical protein
MFKIEALKKYEVFGVLKLLIYRIMFFHNLSTNFEEKKNLNHVTLIWWFFDKYGVECWLTRILPKTINSVKLNHCIYDALCRLGFFTHFLALRILVQWSKLFGFHRQWALSRKVLRQYRVRFPKRTMLGRCVYFYAWAD